MTIEMLRNIRNVIAHFSLLSVILAVMPADYISVNWPSGDEIIINGSNSDCRFE
jgi:hypothetical protein